MAVTQLLCSASNPAAGTAVTTGNSGFGALTTAAGGSKVFSASVGIHSNTGVLVTNAAGTNQMRVAAFTASTVGKVTFTLFTPSSNPASSTNVWNFRDSGGPVFRLQWGTTGSLVLLDAGSVARGIATAGTLAFSTNYTVQINYTIGTSTTGTFNAQVLDASGTPVSGASLSFTGNLGTLGIQQYDADENSVVGNYGVSEIQYDTSTAAGFLAPWAPVNVTVNATPAASMGGIAVPAVSTTSSVTLVPTPASAAGIAVPVVVSAEVALTGTSIPGGYGGVNAPTVTVGVGANVLATPAGSSSGLMPLTTVMAGTDLTITAAPAAAAGGVVAPTVSGDATVLAVPASAGAGALAPIVTAIVVGSATLAGTGTLTAVGVPNAAGAAVLTGGGVLAVSGAPAVSGTAALTGTGTLSVSATLALSGTATLAGVGALGVSTGAPAVPGVAVLAGAGALTAVGSPQPSGSAVLAGTGTVTVAAVPGVQAIAAATGTGTLTATATLAIGGVATLTSMGVLVAVLVVSANLRDLNMIGEPAAPRFTSRPN